MIQVSKFLPPNYETDYRKIDGPTGPCVYPALHLYIHSALYYITDKGQDIKLAQVIYAGLYLSTLALVLACYRRVNAPPWLLIPLILSKRLHSIFLLRLFNDCWATFFFWLSIHGATRQRWSVMTISWVLALGVKMTMLLPFPALLIILVQGAGTELTVFWIFVAWVLTFGSAIPFLGPKETRIYITQAFNLGRQFLYKWTVNWKFVSEETFLSKPFAIGLLALHVALLLAFVQYKWTRPSSKGIWHFATKFVDYASIEDNEADEIASRITPTFVMDALLGSITIGMLCARSLHYQFYAYLGWTTPYLLWRARWNPVIVLALWMSQEFAWLRYPSNATSSGVAVTMLAFQVCCSWISMWSSYPPTIPAEKQKKAQ